MRRLSRGASYAFAAAFLFLTLAACSGTSTQTPPLIAQGADSHGPVTTLSISSSDTRGRFAIVQLIDGLTSSQIQSEAPHVQAVWASFYPALWRAANPSIQLSRYALAVEDSKLISGHDLKWWQTNHPDWILYTCTASGTPTRHLAWSGTGFADVPLAFYRSDVQHYEMSLLKPFMTSHGYTALAADNTDLTNFLRGGNPNFGQHVDTGDFACGTYALDGSFQRRYRQYGDDPQFATDMTAWIVTAAASLHASGFGLFINHPFHNRPTDPNEQTLLSVIDGTLNESGLTDYGKYATPQVNLAGFVAANITWAEMAQQRHVQYFISDYFCADGKEPWNNNAACSTDIKTLPAPLVDWALASYALLNEGSAELYVSPNNVSAYAYRPEFSRTYGAPCAPYLSPQPNVYVRRFAGGFAVINANPATTAASVLLPNHAYTDIEGRAISQPLRVRGADGYMLLTAQNGCL